LARGNVTIAGHTMDDLRPGASSGLSTDGTQFFQDGVATTVLFALDDDLAVAWRSWRGWRREFAAGAGLWSQQKNEFFSVANRDGGFIIPCRGAGTGRWNFLGRPWQ
jgi:hypothetical protein